jgi:hypothetical protein
MSLNEYQHNFEGFTLNAFSLDPELSSSGLEETVKKELTKPIADINIAAKAIEFIGSFITFNGIQINISDEPYSVPEQLKIFREALGNKLDALRKPGALFPKNGNVAIVKGEVKLPLTLCQGGYYDYHSTEP